MTITLKEAMINIALDQLHRDLYRTYEIWFEVGNGDMSVLESNLDEIRDRFMDMTSKQLSDSEQTKFFETALETTAVKVTSQRN
jgi:hypothetical protein